MHELAHDRQADALAGLTRLARAEEGQEDLPFQPRRHARAVVAHADQQAPAAALAGLHVQVWRGRLGGGLLGIGEQGQQGLFKLARVGLQHQALRRLEARRAAARGPGGRDGRLQAREQLTDGDRRHLRRRPLAHASVGAHERGQAFGAVCNRMQGLLQIGPGIGLVEQLLRRLAEAPDRRERVHDLVRQHLHQLLPGLQRFGFELVLQRRQHQQGLRLAP